MSILTQSSQQSSSRWKRAANALLPEASCLLCGGNSGQQILCPDCAMDLPHLPEMRCPRCAVATTFGEHCGPCQKTPRHFDHVQAVYAYEFPCDRLIHALKYGHQLALAAWFAQQISTELTAAECHLLIPMPMHPARLRERGFNQAVEIARVIAKLNGTPLSVDTLVRTRATQAQTGLRPDERRRNIRGAFECTAALEGMKIQLIDDVLTTGASADECARVLKLHGADEVRVAVIARALRH